MSSTSSIASERALSPQETAVVNGLQSGFPLLPRPFDQAAAPLGLTPADLRATVAALLARKVLTRFGPLYQIERMGGQFVLAALEVPEDRFDAVAAQVNAFDAVAHNYRRAHRLNMWFVLAAPSAPAMQQAVAAIGARTGLPVYAFPKLEEYFVGMRFTVGGTQPVGRAPPSASTTPMPKPASVSDAVGDSLPRPTAATQEPIRARPEAGARTATPTKTGPESSTNPNAPSAPAPPDALDAADLAMVRATQAGLPVVEAPYAAVAQQLGWTEAEVIDRLRQLLERGVIRRIGVVPNHYAIGYRFNAMAVFDVDDAAIARLGPQVGALDFVTHCYRRPRHLPLWPYNLFAMCHGASHDAVQAQVQHIRDVLGPACRAHDALLSTRILKKTGLRI